MLLILVSLVYILFTTIQVSVALKFRTIFTNTDFYRYLLLIVDKRICLFSNGFVWKNIDKN